MKEIEYDELDINDDEQLFHMWEPLNFKIKDDYEFIKEKNLFNAISDILCILIYPILWIINKIMFGFRIEGKENLKKVKGGKITVSNHIHPMDCTMNGLIAFPTRIYFPTLKTNFNIPFIRHLIRILYAIPIPEEKSKKVKFITQIKNAIKQGKTIHIYPEGALWPYYEKIRKFKKGAFKIAVELNCPIVPIVFKFEDPNGIFKLYKRKKCIYAKVLEPIYPDNNININDRCTKLINEVIESMEKEEK